MNWTGVPLLAFALSLCGCALGLWGYCWLYQTTGVVAPWLVAVCAAAPAALASRDTSVMRGLLVATVVVWAAAGAEGVYVRGSGVAGALTSFHEHVTLGTLGAFAVAALAATGIASRAVTNAR